MPETKEPEMQEFDEWFTEKTADMFNVEKFRQLGKENDFAFQTLAFMGAASQNMSLAFTLTEHIKDFPEELKKEFRAVAERYHELKESVRALNNDISNVYVFQVCESDSVAALSLEDAIDWYKKETGLSDNDLYSPDEIERVPLRKMVYEDEDKTKMISVGMTVQRYWQGSPFIVTSQLY